MDARIVQCISCGSNRIQTNRNGIPCCEVCGRTYRESAGDYSKELNGIMRLRQDRDFKGAKKGCENLLQTHIDSSEAYWQEMLSDFGIVYDYESGKPIFCYSAEEYENSKGSIKRDPNYQNALRVATDDDKRYYISQAEELDSLLKELLHKKKKEETYLQFSKKQKTIRNVILIILLVAAVVGAIAFGIVKLRDHQMKVESEKRIQETISAIGSIESEISYADLDAIKAAESLYKQLSEEEKSSVSNYNDLVLAREEYDTLIAWASANPLTVSFDARGGSLSRESVQVTYGKSYAGTNSSLPTAEKQGYRFAGWYSELDGSQVTEQTIVSAKVDHTLYAQWTAKTYTVDYDANGGDCAKENTVVSYLSTYGSGTTGGLPTAIRKGHSFDGWFTEKNGGTRVENDTVLNTTFDHTLFAQWTVETYTVSLNANDGTIINGNIENYTYGIGAELPMNVHKEGYIFAGWYTENVGKGDYRTSILKTDTGDKTYYAFWVKIINYLTSVENTEVSVSDYKKEDSFSGVTSCSISVPAELQNIISTGRLRVRLTISCDASLKYRAKEAEATATIKALVGSGSYQTIASFTAQGGGWPTLWVDPAYGLTAKNNNSICETFEVTSSIMSFNIGYLYELSFAEFQNWAGGTHAVTFSCDLSNIAYMFYAE